LEDGGKKEKKSDIQNGVSILTSALRIKFITIFFGNCLFKKERVFISQVVHACRAQQRHI